MCARPALSQLDQLLPIGPRAQFYISWCKLTGNLGPVCVCVCVCVYIAFNDVAYL